MTTLPTGLLAVLALVALGLTAWIALTLLRPRDDRPLLRWAEGYDALLLLGGALWGGLFLFTLAAAFKGTSDVLSGAEGVQLGLGALLAALLGAPFLIWTTWLKHRTVMFQKEGHMTDRISKAVEQLGAEKTVKVRGQDAEGKDITLEETKPNLEVRIGAILSLERIAQDSTLHDQGRDHVRVMEILCAYIRHNAPAKEAKNHPFGDWEPLKDNPTPDERAAHEARREERFGLGPSMGQVTEWAGSLAPPRADIAEALKVLGRRSRDQMLVEAAWPHAPKPHTAWPFDNAPHLTDKRAEAVVGPEELNAYKKSLSKWVEGTRDYSGHRLDLRGTNLQRADLSNALFQGAKLAGARLEGANLWGARLEGADLWETRLEGANLWQARLEGADLLQARLEGANLGEARLEGADLEGARLEGANLREARLQGADVGAARLEGADVGAARLEGANLVTARLEGANLVTARLEGANLVAARLEGADLGEARLEGADLRGAQLERAALVAARLEAANLWRTRLEGANLRAARFDARTSLQDAEFSKASWRNVDLSMLALSQDQINSTFGDASVILPTGLTRPAHWPTWHLPDHDPSGGPTFNSERNRWRSNPSTYTPPPPPA